MRILEEAVSHNPYHQHHLHAVVIIQTLEKEMQIEQNRFIEICTCEEGKSDSCKFGSSHIKLWLNRAIKLIKRLFGKYISLGTLFSRILLWLKV